MLDRKSLKYYKMLRIPAALSKISKYLYLCLLSIILTIYFVNYNLTYDQQGTLISILLLHVISWASLPFLLYILVQYMKLRQCINMSLFLLVPGIPLEIFSMFANIPGLMYIAVPIIGVFSIRGFTYSRVKSLVITFYALFIEILFTLFIDHMVLNTMVIRFTSTLIPMISSIYFAETLSNRRGIDVYRIAGSWVKTMLLHDESDFSAVMNGIGFEENIKTHVMFFDLGFKYVVLLVPEIHFGPFRNVGSASLPHVIDNLFEKINTKSFVLHSAGSHERNLVSVYEGLNYGRSILNKIESRERFKEDVLYEPFRVYGKYFEAFVMQTNNSAYILISTPITGNDDIPYEVQIKSYELSKVYGFEDVAIIDAHNVEGKPVYDLNKYTSILIEALSKSSRPCIDYGVGYGETVIKGVVNGLCSNKVKALSIKCNNSLYGLIYLYGNNAKAGVRDELRKKAIELGYSDAEILTADDHSCSGVSFDSPYHAVELNEALIKAVETALKSSLNNITPCKVYIATLTTRNRIVGPNIFALLELAKDTSQKVLRYLALSYLLMYVLVIALLL
ncbi:MAG: DUF2070 family protein [Ignisphaera sp.]